MISNKLQTDDDVSWAWASSHNLEQMLSKEMQTAKDAVANGIRRFGRGLVQVTRKA